MPTRIMVPLDGSSFGECALPWALTLADAWDATVDIVHAHDLITTPDLAYPAADATKEWATDYLARTARWIEIRGGRTVETTVLGGMPSAVLQERAADSGADLIVMATHGRGPLSRMWLGGVADALLRHTSIPLLLVRPEEGDAEVDLEQPVTVGKVLVSLDGSATSEGILPHARAIGGVFGARYEMVRVFPYPENFANAYLPYTLQENSRLLKQGRATAAAYLEAKGKHLAEEGLDVETAVLVDHSPAAGILHHAEECGTDLIAMASHGHGGGRRALLGSVTDKVVRGTALPMLVVRPGAG